MKVKILLIKSAGKEGNFTMAPNRTVKPLESMSERTKRVLQLIPLGTERKITTKEIADILHVDRRIVFEEIERLVMDYAFPIVATRTGDNVGNYIPTTEAELNEGLEAFTRQIIQNLRRKEKLQNIDLNHVKERLDMVAREVESHD